MYELTLYKRGKGFWKRFHEAKHVAIEDANRSVKGGADWALVFLGNIEIYCVFTDELQPA